MFGPPRLDENFNIIVDFPTEFVFGSATSDPNKKAKKKTTRERIYTLEGESQLKAKPRQKNNKKQIKPKTVTEEINPPPPPPPQPYNINISDSDHTWPGIQRRVVPPEAPNIDFANYKPPQKPNWYNFLLPRFSYLSLYGSTLVPHSSYLNIRLYQLEKIREKYLFNPESKIFGLWSFAQTLKVLLPMLRVRRLIRRFIQLWHIYKCNKREEKLDPFTLCEAETPISIYCMKVHKRYDYDAQSIIKHISTSLRWQSNGFATPNFPKLPQTNEPFTAYQLISIFDQARRRGIWSTVFGNFRECGFNLEQFKSLTAIDLQQRAIITESLSNDSYIVNENINFYFQKECEHHRIYPSEQDYKILEFAVDNYIQHPYLQSWKNAITALLVETNIYTHNSDKKNQITALFHRKSALLLRLFYQFKKLMMPKVLAYLANLATQHLDIFGEEDDEDEEDSSVENQDE